MLYIIISLCYTLYNCKSPTSNAQYIILSLLLNALVIQLQNPQCVMHII